VSRLSLYEYKDYKKYLDDWMAKTPNAGRGQRKLMAEAVGCQTPFITHVLSGDYHFSPEQAEACARWLQLSENEIDFFLLLVLRQRAGTRALENLLNRQISQKREKETHLKQRLKIKDEMSLEDQLVYYSNWSYAVIHMACQIPHLQNIEALQNHLSLSVPEILKILDFLTEHALVEKTKAGYKAIKPVLHLGKDSPLIGQHHSQWRLKAMESFQKKRDSDLSFSGVASLSKEDFEWARERLSQALEDIVARIKDSKDEMLASICFDIFQI
jgi:uncharacterized protein (TIGR02147 family)